MCIWLYRIRQTYSIPIKFMTLVVLFSSLEHTFTTIKTKFKFSIFFCIFCRSLWGHVNSRPPVQEVPVSVFCESHPWHCHPLYFKSGEINSCELSPFPISIPNCHKKSPNSEQIECFFWPNFSKIMTPNLANRAHWAWDRNPPTNIPNMTMTKKHP